MKLELVAKAIESLTEAQRLMAGPADRALEPNVQVAAQAIRVAIRHLENLPQTRMAMLATLLGGDVWDSGGGVEVVGIELPDGHTVTITPEAVECHLEGATPADTTIPLIGDITDYWVVQDAKGNIYYRWEHLGWPSQEEAEQEAANAESHMGVHHWARRQTAEDVEIYQCQSWTREQCIKWLCDNDHNGCFTDEDCRNEGIAPLTLESARDLIAKCLRDVNGLGGV